MQAQGESVMAESNFKKVGETNNGKVIGYRPTQGPALYEICFANGGEVHSSMQGRFVSPRDAVTAITNYLTNHQPKPKKGKE